MTDISYEDQILGSFLDDMSRGKTESTRAGYAAVIAKLHLFLDRVDVAPHLGTDPAALLEIERDFGRHGAFFRVLSATELVCCLPEFLERPWLPLKRGSMRTHISLIGRLLPWMADRGFIDLSIGGCAYIDARRAVYEARIRTAVPARRSDA